MDTKIVVVIVLTILMVVGINGGLILLFRNRGSRSSMHYFQRAFRGSRSPWQDENSNLQELSRLVTELDENADSENNIPPA